MKGLDLSKSYYQVYIEEIIKNKELPDTSHLAIGLVGEGSECFGWDDLLSRDHDWGVRICFWLDGEAYQRSSGIYASFFESLPKNYKGFPVLQQDMRSGVFATEAFFKHYLGFDHGPRTIGEWMGSPETSLALLSNGSVFFAGEDSLFSRYHKDMVLGYPPDIKKKMIAKVCTEIGQTGQYNLFRLLERQDKIGVFIVVQKFIEAIIRLEHLMQNKYTPFYKWQGYSLRRLAPEGAQVAESIENILTTYKKDEIKDCIRIIEELCDAYRQRFLEMGLSDDTSRSFINQAEVIHNKIEHAGLRSTNPWSTRF